MSLPTKVRLTLETWRYTLLFSCAYLKCDKEGSLILCGSYVFVIQISMTTGVIHDYTKSINIGLPRTNSHICFYGTKTYIQKGLMLMDY